MADIAARDASAFERAYDRCSSEAYRAAYAVAGSRAAAEGILERVFMSLWRNPPPAVRSGKVSLREHLVHDIRAGSERRRIR